MASEANDQVIEAVQGLGAAGAIVRQVFADNRVDFSDATLIFSSRDELAEVKEGVAGLSEAAAEIRAIVSDRNMEAAVEVLEALADELEQHGIDVPLYESDEDEG